MNLNRLFAVAITLAVALAFQSILPGGSEAGETNPLRPRPELLVSGRWLVDNSKKSDLRIVDLRNAREYGAGHIPGAVHLPIAALLATVRGIPGMLPPPRSVETLLRQAGIAQESIVVSYDASSGLLAARLFWTLEHLGHTGGRVLDGGWPGWVAQGRAVSREPMNPESTAFGARPQPQTVADLDWVRGHLDDKETVLVDARSLEEFDGRARYAQRAGHIPGAKLFNWRGHLDPKRPGFMRPISQLSGQYRALGLTPDANIVVYCQSLMRASHSYFVLRMLGYQRVRGYDGSWAEWGNRADTPVATGRN